MNTTTPAVNNFCFESSKVRVMIGKNGEPWFIAKDVCDILGYPRSSQAVRQHCRSKGVFLKDTLTSGGNQKLLLIDEGNLYRLVIKSNKPESERFEEWVFEEVLPAIRRTGRYESPSSPAPSPSNNQPAQPVYPHQTKPTRLSFNYRESTVEVVLDANNAPLFNADDIFSALGYARSHGAYHWLRCHAATMRTFPAAGEGKRVERKYFPLELLYLFLRHSGKIEKFRFIRWLEERVLPDLPKVEFTRPAGLLENLVPVHERTPGACYLLTFDGQQQPSITRLASRENASVTFYDTPGKPNFLTTAYYPIDLMLERVRMDAMASGPDRKSVCVSGLV